MENADPKRFQDGVILHKYDEAQNNTCQFKAEGLMQNRFNKPDNALDPIYIQGLFDQDPSFDSDIFLAAKISPTPMDVTPNPPIWIRAATTT